jgi:hypothetical protein
VASEKSDSEDLTDGSHGPRECMPCRGSGQVISNLGGTPGKVSCPWCGGSGVRVAGIDAQAGWPDQSADAASAGADPETSGAAPEPPA